MISNRPQQEWAPEKGSGLALFVLKVAYWGVISLLAWAVYQGY